MADSTSNNDAPAPTLPSAEENPESPFVIDTGDVRLLIMRNGKRVEGKASSHALCLASPVWKRFLFPPWHVELLQVAVLCDQYNCVNLVRPWLLDTLWLKDEIAESLKDKQHKWLFIAWVFGRELVFETLALTLVKNLEITHENFWGEESPMPPLTIDHFILPRNLIAALLKIPYNMLSHFNQLGQSFSCFHHQEACDMLVYGSIIHGLKKSGLFPRVRPEDIRMSVNTLASPLNGMKIHILPSTEGLFDTIAEHKICSVTDMKKMVAAVLNEPLDPILPSHRISYTPPCPVPTTTWLYDAISTKLTHVFRNAYRILTSTTSSSGPLDLRGISEMYLCETLDIEFAGVLDPGPCFLSLADHQKAHAYFQ
ncbi:hypothetical protein BDZ45DRAFT_740062 [Acephala macrosclerotiorum]|nr:hypothetical protein BDZ45DRAFT_740062 [Acephala macrosclerotiorum]